MNVYDIILRDAKNLHYAKRYVNYITACVKKNSSRVDDVYTEKHHILPRNLYPQFKKFNKFPENCAVLTYRQHIIAHWMLWKVFDNFWHAISFFKMCNMETKIPSRKHTYTYAKARSMISHRTDMLGFCVYSDSQGNKHWVKTDDPRIASGDLIHHQKNKAYYKDSDDNLYWLHITHPDVTSGKLIPLLKGVPKTDEVRKNIIIGIHKAGFPAKDAVTGKNLKRIPKSDKRWGTGEIVGLSKGEAIYKDSSGNVIRTSTTDKRVLSGELTSINIGKVAVKNKAGNTFYVNVNDDRITSGEFTYITAGFGVYRNTSGKICQLSVNDARVLSGEFYSIAKGKATYIDSHGARYYIDNTDPRVISGELVSIKTGMSIYKTPDGSVVHMRIDDPRVISGECIGNTKGKAVYKDVNGNMLHLSVDDPRVLSGEFVGMHTGRRMSDEEKYCRQQSIILAGKQAKLSRDGTPIGKIPLNDPRWATKEIVTLRKRLLHLKQ